MQKKTTALIRQGWLRSLLFFIVLVIANFALYYLLLENQPRGYEEHFPLFPALTLFEGMIITGSTVSMIIVFIFSKVIDRIPLLHLGFAGDKRGALTGFFLAGALLGTGSMILLMTGHLQWVNSNNNWKELFSLLMLLLLIAFSEELAFRGYILRNLLESLSRRPAILLSGAGFVLMHAANPGMEVTAIINLMLGGILLGQSYVINRNLWMPICFHFGWNFLQGSVLGYNVSGLKLASLLEMQLSGNEWMTGGEFGFEGSLIATVMLVAGILLLEFRFTQNKESIT